MDLSSVNGLLTSVIWILMLMKADCKQAQGSGGRCELYSGSSCKDYLKGEYVFIKKDDSQKILETRISKWFQRAKSMIGVSDQCWPHAKVLICFHTFPLCGNDRKLPLNRQFCQDECHFLEMFVCRQEFQLAKNINNIKQFVPSCKALPHPGTTAHSNCWRLPSLDESNFPRKPSVAHTVNSEAVVKSRAALKCFFEAFVYGRSRGVTIRWYKNNTLLDTTLKRFKMKRRKRGNFLIISTLIIKHVTFEDAGPYVCIATQGSASVRSGVQLTVRKAPIDIESMRMSSGIRALDL